jgi:hypothetical protein
MIDNGHQWVLFADSSHVSSAVPEDLSSAAGVGIRYRAASSAGRTKAGYRFAEVSPAAR